MLIFSTILDGKENQYQATHQRGPSLPRRAAKPIRNLGVFESRTRPAPRSRFVADPLLWICVEKWISGAKTATREQERGASVPCSYRSMSLESAPDRSYDVPPADERKGKTRAESDRRLGNLIVTHRS